MKKSAIALAVALYIVVSDISAATVNPESGLFNSGMDQLTQVAEQNFMTLSLTSFDGLRSSGNDATVSTAELTRSVPLPAAAWLFMSGLAGLLAMLRRKRNHPATTGAAEPFKQHRA